MNEEIKKPKISFVIPIWNNFHLINQLLIDIRDSSTPDEIIVVDDYSGEVETVKGLKWWADNAPNITVLRPEHNLKFLRASNFGMKAATGDVICLISSDVRVYKDLAAIARTLTLVPEKVLLGGKVYRDSTGWNDFNGKIFPYVEGWLLCATREVWEELGYFDERYAPNDFEDVDLSTTAISKGIQLAEITPDNGPVVVHIGAQTIGYNEHRMMLTEKNRKKFEEKWVKLKLSL